MNIDIEGEIENVYIYVADSLRYDYAPETLEKYGNIIKTAASSTLTCTSFPTILTGLYPPQHDIWTFSGLLSEDTNSVFDLVEGGHAAYFAPGPIRDSYDTIDVENNNHLHKFIGKISELKEPFVVLDRDNLPHMPYGYDHANGLKSVEQEYGYDMCPPFTDEMTRSQYRQMGKSDKELRLDYETAAQATVDRFKNRLKILRDLEMLEKTLVIFTADHGEELGEYGQFTHGKSPVPETIYVPTLFYHDSGIADVDGDFMAHIDIFPTIKTVLGSKVGTQHTLHGYDLLGGAPDNRPIFSAVKRDSYFTEGITEWGVFDKNGGYAFSEMKYRDIIALLARRMITVDSATFHRQRFGSFLTGELNRRNRQFDTPSFSEGEAKRFGESILEQRGTSQAQELDRATKKQLRALGYADDQIE